MNLSICWLRPLERAITTLVQTLAVLSISAMVSSLLLGVFFRYVLHDSLTWSEEVAMLCFSWLTFLTAALMVRENGHVRIELLVSLMPARAYWLLNQIIWIVIALTGVYMAWTGFQFISLTMGQTSPAMRYPIWIRDISLPVGGILISLYALFNLSLDPDDQPKHSTNQEAGLDA